MKKINILFILIVLLSQNMFSQNLKSLVGTEFPDKVKNAIVLTADNKELKFSEVLDSLKGQTIFLDFWASWCGPCIREMKHSKTVQKKVIDKNVAFLFLSTDTDQNSWLKGLKIINIKGTHFRIKATDKHLFQELLKITGIPYYVILDKEGKIANPDAPWPREKRLIPLLVK